MKRITCRDLAKRLGLHPSTVSLALRDHPSLPEKTKERVKALAAELGYRPDPALSALNAYRITKSRVDYKATLAWINQHDRAKYPLKRTICFEGANRRAWELGYELEEIEVASEEQWRYLPRILRSRGIDGMLLPSPPKVEDEERMRAFPWNDFSAVSIGYEYKIPLHHVMTNQFQNAVLAVRELFELGYRRIGMVMPDYFANSTKFRYHGGYMAECARLRIPELCYLESSRSAKTFESWMKKKRPEALIAPGSDDILPRLEQARLRVPEDVALAYLYRESAHPGISAIEQNERQIGIEAANQLIDLIRRNERGPSAFSMHYLIEGRWHEAASTPRIGRTAGKSIAQV